MLIPKKTHNRIIFLFIVGLLICSLLIWRLFVLQISNKDFLRGQGEARTLRTIPIHAYRGMITDRSGQPLAISTPVQSVWIKPTDLEISEEQLKNVAGLLKISVASFKEKIEKYKDKDFVYVQRHIAPEVGDKIESFKIKGLYTTNEYRRYYPTGEVSAHILGFTNIDDVGQEGLEVAYEDWLKGKLGQQRVLKDRYGQRVEGYQFLKAAENGKDLTLSIDIRLQYLAYRELVNALKEHNAKAGSIVMLDAKTNEILAMANLPSYNPNKRKREDKSSYRNRAMTDLLEPASTLKTFSMVNILKSGLFKTTDMIETGPGHMIVSGKVVKDVHNFGYVDIATMFKKSSNVGIVKLTLQTPETSLFHTLYSFGFGQLTGSNFPGESAGKLVFPRKFRPFELATLSFGYGLAVTPIQLASAYVTIANGGIRRPVSLLKLDEPEKGERVVDEDIAKQMQQLLHSVTELGGTGTRAKIPGYNIAGKTGTSKKVGVGGYTAKSYVSLFTGYAPAEDPKIVAVVMIDEPSGSKYFGGEVAAPVFAKVVGSALRILNVPVSPNP